MSLRDRALDVLLWYAVLAWGTWLGGTLYQMLVVVPLWSASPPESVRAFFTGTDYNRTIFHFFGPPFMAVRTLPLLLGLPLAWHRPAHRLPLGIAATGVALATIFTIVYVYPINDVLFAQAGGSGSPEQITAMVRQWIWADRLRFGVGVVVFICLLQAFRLPLRR
jgi:hypothetical protein